MATDYFQQLLGNPNALQALLAAPQFAQPQPQGQDEEAFTRLPSLPALEAGGGAGGILSGLVAGLGGAKPGAQPMDEVPRPAHDEDAPDWSMPAHDEDAPGGGVSPERADVSGVESDVLSGYAPDEDAPGGGGGGVFDALTALKDEPGSPLAMGGGQSIPGLGPDLQANMGLGDQPGSAGAASAPSGGAPGGGRPSYGFRPRPVAPSLDEKSLYPGSKRAVLQAVIPGIVAMIAGLTGGKLAAAGLMQGAARSNEDYNQQLKERGLLRYREAQQKFARDDQIWRDDKAQTEHKAAVISALAEKARSFTNPKDGEAWLRAQIPIYAAQGIDPMEAWGVASVGADERRRVAAEKVVNEAVNAQLERVKLSGKPLNPDWLEKLPDTLMVTWDGKRQSLRAVMDIAGSAPLSLPADATTSEKIAAVKADIATSIESFTKRTGAAPGTAARSAIERDAWSKYEHDKDMADQFNKVKLRNEILQGQHLAASTAALTRQAGDLSARDQQFARSRVIEMQKLKPYVNFTLQGSLRDQFISTYEEAQKENSGISDAALISEYVRFKHPGSSRVGDQEVAIVELSRDGLSSIAQVVPKVFVSGAKLTATQRRQMMQVIDSSYEAASRGAQVVVDDYSHQLAANGVDPSLFIEAHHGSYDKPVMPYWARERVQAAQAAKEQADAGFAATEKQSGLAPAPDTSAPTVNPLGAKAGAAAPAGRVPVGTIVEQDGKKFRITGYDAQGKPTGEPVEDTSGTLFGIPITEEARRRRHEQRLKGSK